MIIINDDNNINSIKNIFKFSSTKFALKRNKNNKKN